MSNKEAFLSIFGLKIKHNHDKLDAIKKIPILCKKNFNRLPFDIIVKYKLDTRRFKKKSFKNIIIMNNLAERPVLLVCILEFYLKNYELYC
jgi:hypothetical protein